MHAKSHVHKILLFIYRFKIIPSQFDVVVASLLHLQDHGNILNMHSIGLYSIESAVSSPQANRRIASKFHQILDIFMPQLSSNYVRLRVSSANFWRAKATAQRSQNGISII